MSITEKTAWVLGSQAKGNKEVVLAPVGGRDIHATPEDVINHADSAIPDGISETAVILNPVVGIAVKTPPTKVTYTDAETLDLTDLVVTLTYSDETTEDVALADFADNGITTSPANGGALTTEITAVVITHTVSSKTASQAITVTASVAGIAVKTPPTKVTYTDAETLDLTDLVVTLTYSDETTKDVALADFADKGITTSPANGGALTTATEAVVITHTVSGKTASQAITVTGA